MHCLYLFYTRKDNATVAVISACPKGIRLGERVTIWYFYLCKMKHKWIVSG